MAAWWKHTAQVLALLIICLTILDHTLTEARRGGGFRSGGARFRSSSSRNRYSSTRNRIRYGSTGSTRVRVRVRNGYGYGRSGWRYQYAATAGAVFGYHAYTRRSYYYSHRHYEPRICINEYDYRMDNGTKYSLFICPMAHNPDNYMYCCGPEDRQTCCPYWSGGRIAGFVIGALIFFGIGGLIIWCVCCKNKPNGQPSRFQSMRMKQEITQVHYSGVSTAPPTGDTFTPVPPPAAPVPGYPPAPAPQPGYPPAPAPGGDPSYPDGKAPYPADPNGPAPPYMADSNGAVPPYGANPPAGPYPGGDPNAYPPGGAPYPPPPDGGAYPGPPPDGAPYPPAQGYPPAGQYPPQPAGQYPPQPAGPTPYPASPPPPYPT